MPLDCQLAVVGFRNGIVRQLTPVETDLWRREEIEGGYALRMVRSVGEP